MNPDEMDRTFGVHCASLIHRFEGKCMPMRYMLVELVVHFSLVSRSAESDECPWSYSRIWVIGYEGRNFSGRPALDSAEL